LERKRRKLEATNAGVARAVVGEKDGESRSGWSQAHNTRPEVLLFAWLLTLTPSLNLFSEDTRADLKLKLVLKPVTLRGLTELKTLST
jgi:hypothetical protein